MTRIAQRGSAQALLAAAALSFLRLSILGHQVATAASVSCTGPNTRYYSLDISQGYAAPDGFARPLYLVNGQTPGPLIEANQGETFLVNVLNRLPIEIGMHWHGLHQEGTPEYDGVPGVNQYAIPPGANMTYCFGTETNYGAYWYHVHLRDIYQDGIRGPLFIHSSSSNPRPYSQISNSSSDISAMQAAEQNPTVLMLNDWFHETSEAISGRLVATNDSMRPLCANSVQFNGMGRVQCPPASSDKSSFGCVSMMRMTKGMDSMGSMSMTETSKTVSKSKTASSANPPATSTAQMDMSGMNMGSSSKLSPTSTSSAMDSSMNMDGMDQVSGASIDPANTMCQDTDAPFYNLQVSSNSQWHMINLVNAGAAQMLSFSIDGHDLWIVSADGAFVKPQKIQILPIGIGQRYGIMLKRPDSSAATQYTIRASTMTHQTYQGNAVLTYVNSNSSTSSGSASSLPNSKPYMTIDGSPIDSSAKVLEDAALAPYPIYAVPNATRELRLMVNQSAPTVWVLEMGHAFNSNNGQQTPLLFAPRNASGVFSLERGEVVDVLLQISKDSLDTMAHPIHLHGHYFRVLGSSPDSTFPKDKTVAQMAQMGSSEYKINTRSDAPQRDSAHLPEAGWLAIRFASSNPGVWLLHCHINSHLSSGMAVAFIELAGELQQFPRNVTSPPPIAPYDPIPSLAK